MPVIVILLIFALVLGASRYFKLKLWACLMSGAVLIGLFFGMSPAAVLATSVKTSLAPKTLEILVILYGIAVFEYTLRITGMLNRLVVNLKKVFRDDRLVLGMLPAFLGFLPSPGGALFSAPLVDEASKNLELSNEQKSFINFWFRHVWETIFPLFPGLILASAMSKIPLNELAKSMSPAVAVSIIAGSSMVFLKKIKYKPGTEIHQQPSVKLSFSLFSELFATLLPILIVICGALFFNVNMIFLIIISIAWAFIQTGAGAKDLKKVLVDTLYSQNLMLIIAIMMFAGILEDSGASRAIPETFVKLEIPLFMIFIAMPFILAVLTGINTAFVGLAFPILSSLAGGLTVKSVSMAYLAGMAGVMVSPVHLCLVLTLNYFKASTFDFYKLLIVPAGALLILAALVGGL
ncbi:MAG TPA: DUF401 family protein [Candidatus Wallbacteria bacterium]|nr:MAG: hypothetical protein BWY32_01263 [bacterium ADurb.Bin243]HOD40051.1 DUF401 family protein [Candidatus Wallbacteria bacterium]HPG58872.1 DUF401 family protein [Candidatus Wallbacteria bacterium]